MGEHQETDPSNSLLRTAAGLDALFQVSPGLYFQLDANGAIQDYRATHERELYVPPDSFLGRRMVDVLPPDVGVEFDAAIASARELGGPVSVEYALTLQGTKEIFLARIVPAPHGQTIVAAQCVTATRNLEMALRATELRYRSIVEGAVEGLFQSTDAGRYLSANPALARIYGYDSAGELIATITDIERQLYVDAKRRAEFVRCLREMDAVHQFESQVYRKDRSVIWISESARAVRDSQGNLLYYEGVVEDITRRKQAEEALLDTNAQLEAAVRELQAAQAQTIQQERLRLVGQMASGIAHDFNNLLSVILGYTEMLAHRPLDSSTQHVVEEIRHAADRAVALTRRILAAGREQVVSRRPMDLNAAIRSLYPMLRRVIRADVELQMDLQPGAAEITADPVQIERALMNLVLNARDALPDGGQVVISTQSLVRGAAGCEASYVVLQVADNGCGMDAETRSHVFEPFFTTKPAGEGTGLGLASVDGMARQSGGLVELYSEVGRGTRVRVLLPQSPVPAADLMAPHQKGAPSLATGTETVLLVEDEPRLRSLLYEVLSRSGYQVFEAANGVEALRLAADSSLHLDLLLTDLVMPGLGGLETAHRLQDQRPGLRVLFMSGYSDGSPSVSTADLGEALLHKPFEPSTLTTRVREILDRKHVPLRTKTTR